MAPGTGETPSAPVFIDGKKAVTLRDATVAADFKQMVMTISIALRPGRDWEDSGGVRI